ncbi:MAG: ATP synthase subunit I [Deltaproteobacteria bacterium]|nr:ATP synthase subunit I [Deltaproteobacteria bacterium]
MNPSFAGMLNRIERLNWVLAVMCTATAGLIWQGPGMLATGVGAAIGVLNFWILRRMGARLFERVLYGMGAPANGWLIALSFLKMPLLFLVIWLVLGPFSLAPIPFTLGISGFVVSIALVGMGTAITAGIFGSGDPDLSDIIRDTPLDNPIDKP